jgi:deferrochelatase/peroxidase EfeB
MAAAAVTGTETLELDDMQGLLVRGYGSLRAACFLLYEVGDTAAARGWLGRIAPELSRASQARPSDTAVNLAITAPGLMRLGVPASAAESFPFELRDGMITPHRQRILGDIDASAPSSWTFGGPSTPAVHVLVLAYARDEPRLATLVGRLAEEAASGGLVESRRLETLDIGDAEHFGFRDGISQPRLAGFGDASPPDSTVAPGEFVLGYRNEYGLYAARPLVDPSDDPAHELADDVEGSGRRDLGRNGSYLVLRQLEQDVAAFWQFADRAASDPADRVRIAAKLVGRWPSGAPLALAPDGDDPARALENDFRYQAEDAAGLRCPLGAHIRRTNPRDSLDPNPGSDASVAVGKRHRLLRRGRGYGSPLSIEDALRADPAPGGAPRGLHFMCLNANISRQFEFIHQTWVNSPKFGGLYDEPDPLLAREGSFSIPGSPVRRRLTGVPRFVTVRGGAYLLLPGLRAVRYLAGLGAS